MKTLKQVFKKAFDMPFPKIPMDEKELAPLFDDPKECLLFGSPVAAKDPFIIQGQISKFLETCPDGYFLIGFWGHGINSYAFYYSRVNSWSKVFLRLGYGGVYMDNDSAAKYIKKFLIRYFDFEEKISPQVEALIAIESMGEGYYKITLPNGDESEVEESLLKKPNFDDRFGHLFRSKKEDSMITKGKSWLWPYLESILTEHKETLFNWRKQVPTTQHERIKNFETWLL